MIKEIGIVSMAALFINQAALAQYSSKELKEESRIASRIHLVNQDEIKMGNMARAKGTTPDVQNYGERLIKDHTAADQALMKVVSNMKLKLTSRPVATTDDEKKFDQDGKALMKKLQASTGQNFDQAFLKGMANGHKAVISQMTIADHDLPQSDLKTFIADTLLPNLHQHYDIAMNLENRAVAQNRQLHPAG